MQSFITQNFGQSLKLKFCLCFTLTAFSFFSFAQSSNWYLSKVLNDNNGLPQNSVRSMYLNKQTGFLWMTTEAGLVRYDGVNARVFDLMDLVSFKTNRLFTFFSTVQKDVLGCNRLGEVFAIKNNSPLSVVTDSKIPIYDFSYQYTNARSVNNLNFEMHVVKKIIGDSSAMINAVWLNKNYWVAISNDHTFLFNNNKLIHQWQQKNETGASLIHRDNFLYVLKNNAEGYFINLNNYSLSNTITGDTVLQKDNVTLFYDKLNDEPLLLKQNHLYKLLLKQNILYTSYVATLTNLPTYLTSVLLNENIKTIFVSTNSTGVYIYHQSPFIIYKTSGDDILNNNAASMLIDSTHIFTCRSILFDLETGNSKHLNIPINHLQSLTQDADSNFWSRATDNSIISFKLKEPGKINKYPVEAGNYLQTSYLAKNKKYWISTLNFLGYLQNNNIIKFISYGSKADSLSFTYFTESPDGRLAGINAKGIYFIDTVSRKIIPVVTNSELSQIRYMHIDSNYFFWITTYGKGMFLYDFKKSKLFKFPVDEKRYLLFSHSMIDDGYGNFLVPTNKGLFRLNKKNLLSIYENSKTPLYYQYFDVSSGLRTNEFNGGGQPAFTRLPNGDIIVPSINGLVRIKMNELSLPSRSRLFVDEVETKTKSYKLIKEIKFSRDERTQVWNISFAQWNAPYSQCIFYRVDNSVWQRLSADEKKVQLNELSGGNHLLEIKYQYGFLQNQFALYSYKFYIGKKFYETIWFWFSIFIALTSIIFFIVRFRNMQLKRKNIQLQKIIQANTKELSNKNAALEETLSDLNEALKGLQENSIFKNRLIGLLGHDMLVPLRFIANISDHLHNAEKLTPELTKDTTGEIKNTAAELLYLGESLIQWIKLEEGTFKLILQNVSIHQLAQEIIKVHQPIAAVKSNKIICNIPTHLHCMYDATFLKVILHNLLLNANKFTANGCITIGASITDNVLAMCVNDTGTGMHPEAVNSLNNLMPVSSQKGTNKETGWGMGYMLIIDLLRFADGRLFIESTKGVGTKVSFSVKV